MKRVVILENAILPTAPRLVARALIVGATGAYGEPISRSKLASAYARGVAQWWAWTTAMPGEVFYCLTRDAYVRVEKSGPPRTVKVVSGYVRTRLQGDAIWQLVQPQVSTYRWWELRKVRP